MLNISHPRTRVFYGKRQKKMITEHFKLPFVGKIPRGSAMGRGVYLIRNQTELNEYLELTDVAYIQEYLPVDRDIRVVVIGRRIVHAYWRIASQNEFRSNIAQGGRAQIVAKHTEMNIVVILGINIPNITTNLLKELNQFFETWFTEIGAKLVKVSS